MRRLELAVGEVQGCLQGGSLARRRLQRPLPARRHLCLPRLEHLGVLPPLQLHLLR